MIALPAGIDPEVEEAVAAYGRSGDRAQLDRGIARLRELRSDPRRPESGKSVDTVALAGLLLVRGQLNPGVGEFDESIELVRGTLDRYPLDLVTRASVQVILCGALMERSRRRGGKDDFGEVLRVTQSMGYGSLPDIVAMSLANFRSAALMEVYELSHERPVLDEAIALLRANAFRASDPTLRSAVVNNLAVALGSLYARTADEAVLDEALELAHDAMAMLRSRDWSQLDHSSIRAACSRASILATRWRFYNDRDDLDEARSILDALVEGTDSSSPNRAEVLFVAASVREDAACVEKDPDALSLAISLYERSLTLADPRTFFHAVVSMNYAVARVSRFELTGDVDDLEAALALQQRVAQRFDSDGVRPNFDHNLAVLLFDRFEVSGDLSDLDEAILLHERALSTGHAGGADRDLMLIRTALARYQRHVETDDPDDLVRAKVLLDQAARLPGITVGRVQGARLLAELAAHSRDWPLCAEAAELVLAAVESVLGALDVSRWDDWLHRTQGISALGGFAAARDGDLSRAVSLVERGCGVIAAGRLAQQRSSLQHARSEGHGREVSAYEAAAERARTVLARGPLRGQMLSAPGADGSAGDLATAVRHLVETREDLVRVAPNLRPAADVAELLSFVDETKEELVYLISTEVGGASLHLRPGTGGAEQPGIEVRWLPDLDSDAVDDLVRRIHAPDDIVHDAGRQRLAGVRGAARGPDGAQVAAVVADLAECLDEGAWRTGTRLVTVGRLGMLPVGAAWRSVDGRALAVGTAGSGLLHVTAHQNAHRVRATTRIAAITNPQPCHWRGAALPELLSATDEGEFLAAQFGAVHHDGSGATFLALRDLLHDESIAILHVAAHGWTSDEDPDTVRLLLADGEDGSARALSLEDLPPRLSCQTVFLACCWLARTATRLPDEGVGFATTLLQAGAARVVAPLWPVDDYGAFQVATAYYENLLGAGMTHRAALAHARDQVRTRASADPRLMPRERLELHAAADAFVLTGT